MANQFEQVNSSQINLCDNGSNTVSLINATWFNKVPVANAAGQISTTWLPYNFNQNLKTGDNVTFACVTATSTTSGNIKTSANSIISTNTNGTIGIAPNGSGYVNVTSLKNVIGPLADNAGQHTTVLTGTFLQLGGKYYYTNNYTLIGYGYYTGNSYPAYMGYVQTTGSNNTYGALVFGTRGVDTDTDPIERMRIAPDGTVNVIAGPFQLNGTTRIDNAGNGTFVSVTAGNLKASSNSIISTNTNGNILITPNGTGNVGIGANARAPLEVGGALYVSGSAANPASGAGLTFSYDATYRGGIQCYDYDAHTYKSIDVYSGTFTLHSALVIAPSYALTVGGNATVSGGTITLGVDKSVPGVINLMGDTTNSRGGVISSTGDHLNIATTNNGYMTISAGTNSIFMSGQQINHSGPAMFSSTIGMYANPQTLADGDWQIIKSGADLLFQKRVSGAWVTKQTISGA